MRIFKYWLGLYKIGKKDKELFKDLLAFCKTSSLDIFSKLIGPLLKSFIPEDEKEEEDHYGDVICYFIDAEWADYQKEARYVDNPIIDFETSQKIKEDIAQQLHQHFAELESKKTPGEKLVEQFRAELQLKYPIDSIENEVTREYLSRDAIIAVFLEVTES